MIRPVALRKESVDRNPTIKAMRGDRKVALRKESVDRNVPAYVAMVPAEVALRKESVDRNMPPLWIPSTMQTSLSARRAWIEIGWWLWPRGPCWGRSPQGERG